MLTELDLNKCPTNSFAPSFFQKILIAQRSQDIMTTYALEQKVFRSPTQFSSKSDSSPLSRFSSHSTGFPKSYRRSYISRQQRVVYLMCCFQSMILILRVQPPGRLPWLCNFIVGSIRTPSQRQESSWFRLEPGECRTFAGTASSLRGYI